MSSSVRKVLIHEADIIKNSILSTGMLVKKHQKEETKITSSGSPGSQLQAQ